MIISKSLFVSFGECPMLAWYQVNESSKYDYINQMQYGAMDAESIGQEVEDVVLANWEGKCIVSVEMEKLDRMDRHRSCHEATLALLTDGPDVIYQAGLLWGDLFCTIDCLVRNEEGIYDIVEIKSKTSIRKKTKKAPLIPALEADVSFQAVVVREVLGEQFGGRVSLAYLNKEYTKQGPINPIELTIIEEVTDELLESQEVLSGIEAMRQSLVLSKTAMEARYPYAGENPLVYFGEKPPIGSIFTIPRITNSKKKLLALYDEGVRRIEDLDDEDRLLLGGGKSDSSFLQFVDLYLQEKVIDTDGLTALLDEELVYPLYFYDYETITVPVPLLEGTKPRQQVVVQYSLHRVDADGAVTHSEGLLDAGADYNHVVIDQLIRDLTPTDDGTYIVWYQGFENTRNKEMGLMYPGYAAAFEKINDKTFDLMEVFKKRLYFDRAFGGSSSIKKVLPVLTDISYDGLAIGHGGAAAMALAQLTKGSLSGAELDQVMVDLLCYCRQDTWAMVVIWQQVCAAIGYDIPDLSGDVG